MLENVILIDTAPIKAKVATAKNSIKFKATATDAKIATRVAKMKSKIKRTQK